MCWSGEASAVVAGVGVGVSLYAAYKKEPAPLWIALGYFTLMEILQAYTYRVIDSCQLPENQIATLLAYIHIVFQPFFINAICLHFTPQNIAQKAAPWAYGFCFFSAVIMLIQLYPMEWAGHCNANNALCGDILCSISGTWHIAWEIPTNGLGNAFSLFSHGFPTYLAAVFILPLIYGSWKMVLYITLTGPLLAQSLTSNPDEWPAIWCLFSIAIIFIAINTRLRPYLRVKGWWGFQNKKDQPSSP